MNIELIGTGSIFSKYNSACTLINEDMIVDVPNGVLKQLLNSNHTPEKINKILITHMHGDHIADIPFLLAYIHKIKQISRKTTIIGPVSIKNRIEKLFDVYDYHLLEKIEDKIEFIELEKNQILENEELSYKIRSIPVIHGNQKYANGYIVENKIGFTGDSSLCYGVENKIGFTGDSSLCYGVERIIRDSEITIADCSRIIGDESHMGIDNLIYLTEKYNKEIIATHINDETREKLNENKISNIIVKEDGYKIQL